MYRDVFQVLPSTSYVCDIEEFNCMNMLHFLHLLLNSIARCFRDIGQSWPWPIRVVWRHRSRDHSFPIGHFLLAVLWSQDSISNSFIPRQMWVTRWLTWPKARPLVRATKNHCEQGDVSHSAGGIRWTKGDVKDWGLCPRDHPYTLKTAFRL